MKESQGLGAKGSDREGGCTLQILPILLANEAPSVVSTSESNDM